MARVDRKANFLWSAVVVFFIQLPLLLVYATDLLSFLMLILLFVLIAAAIGGLYLVLVEKLHADRTAPIPWYASPIVWLGVVILLAVVVWLSG